jgi:hypothetical protein
MGGQTEGLALGPQVRSQRAHLRRCIESGEVDLAALVEGGEPRWEEVALSMQIGDLLGAVDGLDLPAGARVLSEARVISSRSRLGDLTIERRRAIAANLRRELTGL